MSQLLKQILTLVQSEHEVFRSLLFIFATFKFGEDVFGCSDLVLKLAVVL